MKWDFIKIFKWLLITGVIVFALSYQSLLIDRSVSTIPFTPNVFVSVANVKKVMTLKDHHTKSYGSKLNDTIKHYRAIAHTPSNNDRVTAALWEVKYDNMTPENLLEYLRSYLRLLEPSDKERLFSEKRIIFVNSYTHQYLEGVYHESNNTYLLIHQFPCSYISYEDRSSFLKSLKDFFIGAPH